MPVKYRIHPAIGIARVGDSPEDFFIGPEAPGIPPTLNTPGETSARPGKYKDQQQQIKRQGARFRVYAYVEDAAGVVTEVNEITDAEAEIEWEVHLANRKAAAPKLEGPGLRNNGTKERSDLIIDAGAQRISGPNRAMKTLRGTFMKTIDVQLGDLLTDAAGRLIVLGGHGQSQSLPHMLLPHFADNDGWCDDASDGPVRATLRLHSDARPIAADPAWVVVAPPDFAPQIENVLTLYDTVYNMMVRLNPGLAISDATVSFTRHIYPILRRVSNLHWVSTVAAGHHGPDLHDHFISRLDKLSSKDPESSARSDIFEALRSPQGGGGRMPKLPAQAVSKPGASLTQVQYGRMERWAQGEFDADWPGAEPAPTPFESLPEQDRPRALDRAALEACVGGPFFPGIEISRVMLEETTYDARRPFRIKAELAPGTLTAPMAVPWQADFNDCSIQTGADWWPGQRPNQVRRGQERAAEWVPPDWNREGSEEHMDMLNKWSQLGFVVPKTVGDKVEYVEDERFLRP